MSLNTTPRTWVAGEVPTAANFNTEVRDALTGIQAAWDTYTPSLTGFTATVNWAHYRRIGKTVQGQVKLTLTSAVSANMAVSLPVAAHASHPTGPHAPVGQVHAEDTGTAYYGGAAFLATATTVQFVVLSAVGGFWANTHPFTWVSGDVVGFNFTYEAA